MHTITKPGHQRSSIDGVSALGIGPELKEEGLVHLPNTTPRIQWLELKDTCNITDVVLDVLAPPAAGAGVQQHAGVAFVQLAQQQQVRGVEICCGGLLRGDAGGGSGGDGADAREEGVLP